MIQVNKLCTWAREHDSKFQDSKKDFQVNSLHQIDIKTILQTHKALTYLVFIPKSFSK